MPASGARNARFNNGLCFDRASGRWKIMCRDGTQMWFYRGVMAAHLGRLLTAAELVHHKNEDPSDDRLENLELTSRGAHMKMHRAASNAARVANLPRGAAHPMNRRPELRLRGEDSPLAKLTWERVGQVRALSAAGVTNAALARRFGVSNSTIRQVVLGRTWK